MKKGKTLNIVLVGGLLLTLTSLVGCASTETGGTGIWGVLPLILIMALLFGMVYFLMVRPLRQREKKHDQMVEELEVGDRVITAGGVYGEVDSIDEDSVVLTVESGAKIRVAKGGVLSRRGMESEDTTI